MVTVILTITKKIFDVPSHGCSARKSMYTSFFFVHGQAYLVIQEKYTARYVDGFRRSSRQVSASKEPETVRQYVHLLPRSVIYFEDFLSSCTSRHAQVSLRTVRGSRVEYFSVGEQRETRRDIFQEDRIRTNNIFL